jgi:hypothetical protein
MADVRCYTTVDVLAKLKMPRRTFSKLKKTGKLPFLQELLPRLGKHRRYRADLVDQYLDGQWDPGVFARGPRRSR